MSSRPPRWNHNLHYHRVILAAVPAGARRSLDVGCGVGMLARDLRRVVARAAGAIGHRVLALRRSFWEDSAPRRWPPPDTFAETRRLARRVLPGVRYRRLLLWRYSLVWTKPA